MIIKIRIILVISLIFIMSSSHATDKDIFSAQINERFSSGDKLRIDIRIPNYHILSNVNFGLIPWEEESVKCDYMEITFYQLSPNNYFIEIDKAKYRHNQDYRLSIETVTNHYNFSEFEASFTRDRIHIFKMKLNNIITLDKQLKNLLNASN